jgi:hypothetical protein
VGDAELVGGGGELAGIHPGGSAGDAQGEAEAAGGEG